MTTQKVWICFHYSNQRACKSFDGETILDEPSANHEHYKTSLGVYDGSPFAVGDYYHKEVEHFKDGWTSIGQFPFVSQCIWLYSTVTVNNIVYIIGGADYLTTIDLAEKYEGSWERIGSLLQPRRGHRSILQGNKILHIGGYPGDQYFEEWTIGENDIQKKKYNKKIKDYYSYPESFWVPSDFCTSTV